MSNSLYLKGPLYYRETDQDIFWGRDEEIDDIYYLVSNSDFSICYAKSGEGKSSLINAGLIPLLRERGFLPICIRFTSNNYKEKKPNFDNIIGEIIEEAINKVENGSIYKSLDINLLQDEMSLCDALWWKLRVNEIRKDAFTQLTPVLIFDQFEEVFTCSENIEWVSRFFTWLECLYNDMNPLDDANIGRLPKKFKVLLSLRSEYVCELDYWSMQRYFIPSLKNNRYYLKSLTEKSTEKIVNNILSRIEISNISKEEVINFSQNDEIEKSYADRPCKSALKLSLLLDTCYRYSEKIKDLVDKNGNTLSFADILEIYYDESTKELSREQRYKLEDLLVDRNGRRTKVSIADISAKTKISENQLERLKEKRIITTTNSNDIEIAHDCMCEIVSKHSAERRKIIEQERIQAMKNKWFVMIFVLLSFCGVALFLCFHNWGYPAIKENFETSKNLILSFGNTLFSRIGLLCLLPYLLPLTAILIYCRMKKEVKEYVKITDILSVVCGTLSIIAACFLRDTIFCNTIGTPNFSDSIWYAVVPLLLYLSFVLYLWDNLNIKRKTIFCFPCVVLMFPIIEISNVFFNGFTFLGFGLVSIGLLVVTFKKLSVKGCVFCVTMNTLVLAASIIAHLGFCPWKIINYSEVKEYSTPWKYIIIEKGHRYGALDAITGDTIVPCLFDGITRDRFIMLLSPKFEELSDSLFGGTDANSIKELLKNRGVYAQLNNKNGISYVWKADKKLYDISKEDTIYKGKAAKIYFAVRDGLYKAIKQNTSINKIDTTALMALYRMERDSIDTLCNHLKDSSSIDDTELILTHTTRQMAIATMIDMINDNRSKYSLLIAFSSYKLSYFSKELYDEHINFAANIKLNYNEQINHNLSSNDTILSTGKTEHSLSWNAKFSNNDFSMLGVLSLGQYVYLNTMSLTIQLYNIYLKKNLQSMIDEIFQPQKSVLEQLSKSISFDSKDVDKVIANLHTGKDLAESIRDIVSLKYSGQIHLVDSLTSINDKYKSFSPFSFFNNKSLKNVRNTAYENIQIFYTLYDCCSNRDDYHYAIFRQKMIDNLQLASFCGSDITNNVNCLEKKDSIYFNYTYGYLKGITDKVNKIRENARNLENKELKETKKILQRIYNCHK